MGQSRHHLEDSCSCCRRDDRNRIHCPTTSCRRGQKSRDRVIALGESLSSGDPSTQRFAIAMLRLEKEKHPNEVPDEILALALPELINLAASAPSASVASEAKDLAIELTAETTIAESVESSVEDSPARVYFHIRDESQRQQAIDDARRLEARLGEDFVMPGVERVSAGPAATELRYFRPAERAEATTIVAALNDCGVADLSLRYTAGYETRLRLRHYELWYAPTNGSP